VIGKTNDLLQSSSHRRGCPTTLCQTWAAWSSGIDFTWLHFRPKTFRINFYYQLWSTKKQFINFYGYYKP
jgi:hypothetical protein